MSQQQTSAFFIKHPANEITKKQYTLEADMATGWIPNMKCIGPVPLNFDNRITDFIIQRIDEQEQKNYKIFYLGSRPLTTFRMHEQLSKSYPFKYEYLYNNNFYHLNAFYRKFYSYFQPKSKRKYHGMNKMIQKPELIFDSLFQSGNLDAVIQISKHQFDLFLRIDSNTRGHLQWYYFKIKSKSIKKVKLNIVNFKKAKTLYTRGMRPFISRDGKRWHQGGKNVTFNKKKMRYECLQQFFSEQKYTYQQLSFQLQFSNFEEEIYVAYCIPYTYGRLCHFLQLLKQNQGQRNFLKKQILCQSLSGIQIPLLKITNFNSVNKKKCIFMIARQHPGESNSNFVLQGFLNWLCSQENTATSLRDDFIFKIVPMLNPDGVILGNYRTSLCGRDLNRLYLQQYDPVYPQVQNLKQEIIRTKKQFKNNFIMFIDIHGHSSRRNVFMYGPDCGIWESNYYKAKMFPRLISNRTQMFRFYSCSFRITASKKSTARAVFSKYSMCYTLQSSNGLYYSEQQKKDIEFDALNWRKMGQDVIQSMYDYLSHLKQQIQSNRKRLMQRKLLIEKKRQNKKQMNKSSKQMRYTPKNMNKIRSNSSHFCKNKQDCKTQLSNNQIKKIDAPTSQKSRESDNYSSNGQDSSDGQQDLNETEFKKFAGNVSKMLNEFQSVFYKNKISAKILPQRRVTKQFKTRYKKKKQIQLISCLKNQTFLNTKKQQKQKSWKITTYNKNPSSCKSAQNHQIDLSNICSLTKHKHIKINTQLSTHVSRKSEIKDAQYINYSKISKKTLKTESQLCEKIRRVQSGLVLHQDFIIQNTKYKKRNIITNSICQNVKQKNVELQSVYDFSRRQIKIRQLLKSCNKNV